MRRLERARGLIAGTGGTRLVSTIDASRGAGGLHLGQVALALGGSVEATSAGPCVVVHRTYDAAYRYGRLLVGEYPRPALEELAVLGGLPSVPNGDGGVVCFDLETTGLSGGAGTVAFLVGFGWFDRGAFRTCQYFLPTLAAERRMLNVAATMLERAATLVTFNGKSFDVPIADARFAFHRLASPFGILGHVDLLHPARRLWPLSDTRLTGLEQAVLGIRRDGDVPSAEIPARYVAFLRGGDPELVAAVLEHNRLDLASLGLLTGLACEILRLGVGATTHPAQALGLGQLYEKAGLQTAAVACYQVAARGPAFPDTRCEALRRLASSHRRSRRYAEAAESWQALLTIPGLSPRVTHEASVALAIHYEHRSPDLALAERLATRALARERRPRRRLALEHRVRRITRKLERALTVQTEPRSLLGTSSGESRR